MKTSTALAMLLALVAASARADDDDKLATLRAQIELTRLEHDVNKQLLQEMMLLAGRARLGQAGNAPRDEEAEKRAQVELAALENRIKERKDELIKGAVELDRKTAELSALEKEKAAARKIARPNQGEKPGGAGVDDKDRQAMIEKMEEAQIEAQVLQTQAPMFQQALGQALNDLAAAEYAADDDESKREKADAERKRFNKIKARYVEYSKKLIMEQEKASELRGRLGLGMGMGMGMGFGGGMR